MRAFLEVNGRRRGVDVRRAGGRFIVRVDEQVWSVGAVRVGPRSLSLLVEAGESGTPGASVEAQGRVLDGGETALPRGIRSFHVSMSPDVRPGELMVGVGGQRVRVARLDALQASGQGGSARKAGPERVGAPMPGKIVRVLVKIGEDVREGQPLVVVEAMKMENELRSPRQGVVCEISAREGELVDAGATLAVIAPATQEPEA